MLEFPNSFWNKNSANAIQHIFVIISLNYLPCRDETANVKMKNLWININRYRNCNRMKIKCKLKRINSLTMTILNNLFITKRSNSHIECTYKYCVQRTTQIFMHFMSNIRWHALIWMCCTRTFRSGTGPPIRFGELLLCGFGASIHYK